MRKIAAVFVVLAVAGCGSNASDPTNPAGLPEETASSGGMPVSGESSTTTTSPSAPAATVTSAPATTTAAPAAEDLTVFIATLEELLAGTAYAGEALGEPDLFVATGRLFCERLGSGTTPDEVLTEYLAELTGGAEVATDDELVLAGALLGAAAGALCPEYADLAD